MNLAVETPAVRHEDVVDAGPVASFGATVADAGAGVLDEAFDSLDVRNRIARQFLGRAEEVNRQVLDLLDVEHRVALQVRNRAVFVVVLILRSERAVLDDEGAFFALADLTPRSCACL